MSEDTHTEQPSWHQTARAYLRGVAGGLLVAMPLLMTMEMWWLGFYMPPYKLLLFLVFGFGVLFILEYYGGFRRYDEVSLVEEGRDAVAAYGLAFVLAGLVLWVLRILRYGTPWQEAVTKVALMAIPISLGVSVAVSQLGRETKATQRKKEEVGFWGFQAMAVAGALLFGFSIAPTTEPQLIGLRLHGWNALVLIAFSVVQVHAVIYYLNFRGRPEHQKPPFQLFMSSLTSYAVALLLAAYLLWTFGRFGPDIGLAAMLHMTVTLGFVTSLGAAAGKLIV